VKRRRVQFTATARRHVLREREWWVANREQAEAFTSDLDRTIDLIATLPGVDDDTVIVRGLWGARRRRGPRLADEP
jgi:hypothetical protein